MLVRKAAIILLLWLLVAGSSTADAATEDSYLYKAETEVVKEYTGPESNGDFETYTKGDRIVEFYMPFCGHCRRFKPDYIALATKVSDVAFYAVSCQAHNDKCKDYKVSGWPTLFIFPGGSTEGRLFRKGSGEITAESLREAFKAGNSDAATEQRKLGDNEEEEEDEKEEGRDDEKEEGDRDRKNEGGDDVEEEGDRGGKNEGGDDEKEEGGDDDKEEGDRGGKNEGGEDEKEEGGDDDKEEGVEDGENEEQGGGDDEKDEGEKEEQGDGSKDETKDAGSRKGDKGKKEDDDDDDSNEDEKTKAEVAAARARSAQKLKEALLANNARNKVRKEVALSSGLDGADGRRRKGAEAYGRAREATEGHNVDRFNKLLAEQRRSKDGRLGRLNLPGRLSRSGGALASELQKPPEGATTTMKANRPGTAEFQERRNQLIEAIRRSQGQAKAEQVRQQLEAMAASRSDMSSQIGETPQQRLTRIQQKVKLPVQKEVTKPRFVEKIPIVKKIVKMSHEEELILDVSLSFIHGLKLGVFKSRSALSKTEQIALEDWLQLVRISLPQEWALHSLLDDLLDSFGSVVKSHEGLIRVIERHPMRRGSWSNSCAPPGKEGGGFTCGFWKLLHTVSVGIAEHKGGLNVIKARMARSDAVLFSPELAADTIRDYIANFFPCTDCANHFVERFDDCSFRRCIRLSDDIRNSSDADWKELAKWLWEFHNEVSVRLLHEKADKKRKKEQRSSLLTAEEGPGAASRHDEIAALWPSLNECIACFREDGRWNEDAVFVFLEKEYWPPSVLDRRAARLLKFEGEADREFNLTLVLLFLGLVLLYYLRESIVGTSSIQETLVRARALRPKAGSGAHKRSV